MIIITNSANLAKLSLAKETQVIVDDRIPIKQWTGKWTRTPLLRDDRFTQWVDLVCPSRWAQYFGLVEKEMKPAYYIIPELKIERKYKEDFSILQRGVTHNLKQEDG